MTPNPPRINVPALIKRYGIDIIEGLRPSHPQKTYGAFLTHLGLPYASIGHSKRKAVLSVLKQANLLP